MTLKNTSTAWGSVATLFRWAGALLVIYLVQKEQRAAPHGLGEPLIVCRLYVCKAKEDLVKISKWMVLAATMASAPCAAYAQTLVSERSISVNAALEMATAALDACRKHGSVVTITVLDRAGRTVAMVRDDGASPHSIEHSLRKAYTALTYNMPSGEYGKRAAANPGSAGPLHLANITTAAGGLPIRAGDALVGAIGISGTPAAKDGGTADEGCAQAGIDRVAKGLGSGM